MGGCLCPLPAGLALAPGCGSCCALGSRSFRGGGPCSLGTHAPWVPPNQVLMSRGWRGRGALSSPPQSSGLAPVSQCSHPRGLRGPSVGQMSHVGRCPALWARNAHRSAREAAGASKPGLCQGFFVLKWQKHLSLAEENQEPTGIDHEKLDGCVPGPMSSGQVCPC